VAGWSAVDTTEPSVPPAPFPEPVEPPRRRHRRLWAALGVLTVLLTAAVVGAAFITVPYYTIAPGNARATEPLIDVDVDRTYPSDGAVLFTTVSVGHATLLEALQGWLDRDVDVLPEEDILGDQSPDQNRELNLQLMDNSKEVATVVALRELGYDVPSHGTGALVVQIDESLPAAAVVEPGDTIVGIDGRDVALSEDLVAGIQAHQPGDEVTLTIDPAGEGDERTETVVLAERAAEEGGGPVLGVFAQTRDLRYDLPFSIDIDSGSVGGPSAGLAFTLGVLDVLTPGELTGGEVVAATGTIDGEGNVGPVGGVAQKTVTVRESGADVFLVPADEYDQAVARAGDDLTVVRVATLDDALEALADLGGNALALGQPGQSGGT
jgi:Lon-like protease